MDGEETAQRSARPAIDTTQSRTPAATNVAANPSSVPPLAIETADAQPGSKARPAGASDSAAAADPSSDNHFLEAHGASPKRHELHQNRAGPLNLRHLWKPPIIRQFLRAGKLYKESAGREPSRLELFFDLAYAGIIHQLAEGTAETPNGIGLAKFILIFYPSWSIWKDVRDYSNISGTDDVRMRLYILITMLLLYGYSANISSVEVERNEETGHWDFVPESIDAIHAGISFYLIAKGVRLASFLEYAWALPRFRIPLLLSAGALLLNAIIYLPATFVDNHTVLYILPAVAILLEIASRYGLAMLGRLHHDNSRFASTNSSICIPAINVEHLIERTLQFVVIVFGEVVINASYLAHPGEFGAHTEYGRSALAIIIAFALIWLYFDSDSSRTYIHALRRHWFTNISYTLIHFPLTGAIILFSASLARIIPESEIPDGVKWFFSGGIATALACIGLIGTMHRGMDQYRSGILPRSVRLALRFAVAALLATFPLFHPDDMTVTLGIVAAILSGLVAVETLGKLGAMRLDIDDTKYEGEPTAATHRQEKATKHWNRHKADLTEGEKGEEDVGVEESLGDMEVRDIHLAQRLAYTA